MEEVINYTANKTPIEIALGIDDNGMTTAKKLYEFLELNPKNYARWCKVNILENTFAEENVDFWAFFLKEEREFNPNPTQDYKLTARFAKKLSMMQKNERGEQAREYFTIMEEKQKEITLGMQQLSPELQMFSKMFEAVAKQELEQKRQAEHIRAVEERVDNIREVVALNSTQWRKDTTNLINKMAIKLGGYEHIKFLRDESYRLLEQRFGVALGIRLTNRKKSMALNGASKSQISKLNQLDVINEDKKLIEGYVAIVKDMALKYDVA